MPLFMVGFLEGLFAVTPQERGERTFAFVSFGNEKERGLDTWKGRVGIICVLINIGGFFKGPLVITRNSNTEFRPLN